MIIYEITLSWEEAFHKIFECSISQCLYLFNQSNVDITFHGCWDKSDKTMTIFVYKDTDFEKIKDVQTKKLSHTGFVCAEYDIVQKKVINSQRDKFYIEPVKQGFIRYLKIDKNEIINFLSKILYSLAYELPIFKKKKITLNVELKDDLFVCNIFPLKNNKMKDSSQIEKINLNDKFIERYI